jgi:ribosomal protein L22
MANPKDTKKAEEAKSPEPEKPEAKPKAKAKAPAKPKSEAKPKAASKPKAETKPAAKTKAPAKPRAKPTQPAKPIAPPVVRAKAQYVRVAPRKVRLVADQVRGLQIDDARALLRFSTRSAARDVAKLLDSAAANAENNHDLVADDLKVSEITVNEGPTLRRYRPRALGRATRINKRTSHISVALVPEED